MIPRIPVDRAIERWLRALAAASSAPSTCGMIANAQTYGCPLHGCGTGERALPGLVGADYIVEDCTEMEVRVLILRYWWVVSEPKERDPTGAVVQTETRRPGYEEIGAALGISARMAREHVEDAREKVAAAIRGKR